jgi:hypothetical protein
VPNPTPASVTATRRLADTLLDGGLDDYVRTRRGQGRAWRRIAMDLLADTKVDVSEQTLRSWYPELRGSDDRAVS